MQPNLKRGDFIVTDINDQYIATQLKQFNLTDSAIAELQVRSKGLTINGVEDTKGYNEVKSARIVVKTHRVDVDKRRKELTEDALKYQRAINSEAKRITELLAPIEKHLSELEDAYIAEKEAIKAKKEEEAALALQVRIDKLLSLEFRLNGTAYSCDYVSETMTLLEVKSASDLIFNQFIAFVEGHYKDMLDQKAKEEAARKAEQERLEKERLEQQAKEEAARKAEQDRLEKQRLEQEAEIKRLNEITRQQAELAAQLKAENDRLEALRIEAERLEAQRIEDARLEALRVENERIEALKREEDARLEARRSENALESLRVDYRKLEGEALKNDIEPIVHRVISIDRNMIREYLDEDCDISNQAIDGMLQFINQGIDAIIDNFIYEVFIIHINDVEIIRLSGENL